MQKTLPIHFAPLQGYTDVIYRNAHAACFGGIDAYYTPFVRLEKGTFRHPVFDFPINQFSPRRCYRFSYQIIPYPILLFYLKSHMK